MKRFFLMLGGVSRSASVLLVAILLLYPVSYASSTGGGEVVKHVKRVNPTVVDVILSGNQRVTFDFYADNIFRMFQDNTGGILRDPEATPSAKILVDNPRGEVSQLSVEDKNNTVEIASKDILITIDKSTALFTITNRLTGDIVVKELKPKFFEGNKVTLTLKAEADEQFFGGGVQNGRFTHRGQKINIVNENSWTDGGVASPTPFYWSTGGYAFMWNTFKPGAYYFDTKAEGDVVLSHDENYLDVFFMVNDGAVALLNDFYQLTGTPVLVPKFGFYIGHLNAYNRDYWTEVEQGGILFEDGKRYTESAKKSDAGIKESLNGENNNYQFSARAVIDRYATHDMPLGWLLSNDGYGAGYGQDSTIDLNVANLARLGEYAMEHGVEIGLWTQSDLYPKEGVDVVLQRDIVKEVRDAGVRALKTDVAWVGAGYSFGLNGVTDVAHVMNYYGDNARPFIVSLDGWAGTQRYATIWSGDQSGGEWEYIRFHIPTYLGSGLSGQPNISSDMDGIFGGNNPAVNTRDYQWKTFTPQLLNMDGWGANPKYPQALGEPVASINRMYLKLRSELMPYIYTTAHESVRGLPMVRAMFLEYPNHYTYSKATQYQFLFGSDFLVAPIYQNTQMDAEGNDIRNNIYLPEGQWVDYFSGDIYEGGRVINNFDAPLWKLPVFVKRGAIIAMTNANNNPLEINTNYRKYEFYPYGASEFTEYDDDGLTMLYASGESVSTRVSSVLAENGELNITIDATQGGYEGFETTKTTELVVNVTAKPSKLSASVGGKKVKLTEVSSLEQYEQGENVYFYNAEPNLNRFATKGSDFEGVIITKNPQLLVKLAAKDVTKSATTLKVKGFEFAPAETLLVTSGAIAEPSDVAVAEGDVTAYAITPRWSKVTNADCYEIEYEGVIYSTIKDTFFTFTDLLPETNYSFKLRAVNKSGATEWVSFVAVTDADPLEFAIRGIEAVCSTRPQGGQEEYNMFDFDERSVWHTDWGMVATPFELLIDLNSVNTLDKLEYLSRPGGGNGTFAKGTISYSYDKQEWSVPEEFMWDPRSREASVYEFKGKPEARYIKFNVELAIGGFGSAYEIYVFKVPGTSSFIPGDINSDGKLDTNDLMSYMNYTGLRLGDSDFEGYVSVGDVNRNNLIDAYDISNVAIKLDGGVKTHAPARSTVAGSLVMSADKKSYKAGEDIVITVKGQGLEAVNALSFAMPYDATMYEFVSIKAVNMKDMHNMTNDRLHTNGVKSLYPTFVNLGEKAKLSGSEELFTITLKARKSGAFNLKVQDIVLVDKYLNSIEK